jgi:hypothetical protein
VRVKGTIGEWYAGLGVRLTGDSYYQFIATNDGVYAYKKVGANLTPLNPGSQHSWLPGNTWRTLRVDCVNDRLYFYYEGQAVCSVEATLPEGSIKLDGYDKVSSNIVCFDDVKVRSVDLAGNFLC